MAEVVAVARASVDEDVSRDLTLWRVARADGVGVSEGEGGSDGGGDGVDVGLAARASCHLLQNHTGYGALGDCGGRGSGDRC